MTQPNPSPRSGLWRHTRYVVSARVREECAAVEGAGESADGGCDDCGAFDFEGRGRVGKCESYLGVCKRPVQLGDEPGAVCRWGGSVNHWGDHCWLCPRVW